MVTTETCYPSYDYKAIPRGPSSLTKKLEGGVMLRRR